ncbi:MAG: hypothetical protein U9R56_07720, partial [candidate division Zixibacteria bacterium]|nr:hypothetical protein [candidate division Zixibacteria bacterium]
MSQIKRFSLIIVLSSLIWVACHPPVLYQQDIRDYNHVVARADTFFDITMAELYDSINTSQILSHGGIFAEVNVKSFLDELLCDTLAGILARDIKLGNSYDDNRLYRLRYDQYLTRSFVKVMVYEQVEADSLEIVDFYFNRPDLFAVEEQVLLDHILVSPVGLKLGSDSAYYRSLTPEQFNEELREYA